MIIFATLADFQARYDSRMIAQLSNDGNVTVNNNLNIQQLLDDASSVVNSNIISGAKYDETQIQNLINSGDTTLKRLTCDLCYIYAVLRRGKIPISLKSLEESVNGFLTKLQNGTAVLNIPNNLPSFLPSMVNNNSTQNLNIAPAANLNFFGGPQSTPNVNTNSGGLGIGSGSYSNNPFNNY